MDSESKRQINRAANDPNYKLWSEKDIELLRELVQIFTTRDAAEYLGRTHMSVKRACDRCGIERIPQKEWAKYVNEEIEDQRREKIGDAVRGEKNSRWLGGSYGTHLYGEEYRSNRIKVLDRDCFACVECESKESLVVHHVIPWRLTQDSRMENMVTLCISCHNKQSSHKWRSFSLEAIKELPQYQQDLRSSVEELPEVDEPIKILKRIPLEDRKLELMMMYEDDTEVERFKCGHPKVEGNLREYPTRPNRSPDCNICILRMQNERKKGLRGGEGRGRKSETTDEQRDIIREMTERGCGAPEIGRECGLSPTQVKRERQKMGLKSKHPKVRNDK